MTSSERLASVRRRLLQWIADHEAADHREGAAAGITGESILIRDDFYVGRQFRTPRFRAVWFIEEDQLKIYDVQGSWLATLSGAALDGPQPGIVTVPLRRLAEPQRSESQPPTFGSTGTPPPPGTGPAAPAGTGGAAPAVTGGAAPAVTDRHCDTPLRRAA